jgi:polyferredoxin
LCCSWQIRDVSLQEEVNVAWKGASALQSFDRKQLHLMGVAFDMQELYLMPFLLMLLFLGIFAVTAVGGRAWCGWACPQTISV